jgi:signal transduction histidine kinase/CheY-like chemotaxis protein
LDEGVLTGSATDLLRKVICGLAAYFWKDPTDKTDKANVRSVASYIKSLLATDFMPHGYCLRWHSDVLWLHVLSDALITLAYLCIPILLVIVMRKRKDIPFDWLFAAFATFILACGATHAMSIVTVWIPLYRLEGFIKLFTAFASIITAIALARLIPVLLTIPNASQLREANKALAQEITARHAVEKELQQYQEELKTLNQGLAERNETMLVQTKRAEEASRAKSEFLANMSHEIRTPMNGVMGMIDLAMESTERGERQEFLTMARASAESLLRTINEILDFSKIEADKLELEFIDFDLRDSVEETVRSFAFQAGEKGIELISDFSPDIPAVVHGDPGRLRQVITNLLGNALKFTEHGEIALCANCKCEDDRVHFHFIVRDTGIGIPEEKRDLIFNPFSQADSSTARKHGGTGLGLTISTRLVHLMGGRIWVESEVGKGSAFHFTADLGRSHSVAGPPGPADLSLVGVTALIVDDHEVNRRMFTETLRRWGMLASAASGGREALVLLRTAARDGAPFRFLITDSHMPEMDGFMLAEQAVSDTTLAPLGVVMLTSAGRRGDAARCRETGVTAYLNKPLRSSDLKAMLLSVLSNRTPIGGEDLPPLLTRYSLSADAGLKNLRILLAEDNAINQRIARSVLEKRGYSVTIAMNGRQALEQWEKHSFDLILMDGQMPEMDGFEATELIRRQEKISGRHIPIIALTAHALKGDEERCLSAGMDSYVTKPIQAEQLFHAIESVLTNRISDARTFAGSTELLKEEQDAPCTQ